MCFIVALLKKINISQEWNKYIRNRRHDFEFDMLIRRYVCQISSQSINIHLNWNFEKALEKAYLESQENQF